MNMKHIQFIWSEMCVKIGPFRLSKSNPTFFFGYIRTSTVPIKTHNTTTATVDLGRRMTHLAPPGHLIGEVEAGYLLKPCLAAMQMISSAASSSLAPSKPRVQMPITLVKSVRPCELEQLHVTLARRFTFFISHFYLSRLSI
jgi:hypothetical protein